ncbi:MAG TPA: hypothetical protein VMX79_11430 [bacterium]|nr:hypothetical protein [bacterium]
MNGEPDVAREHRQRHRLQGLFWASVLIWAGIIFTAESTGRLPQLGHAGPWNWLFFGAGLLALLGALWRGVSPTYARPVVGNYIWAGILIIIGLSGVVAVKITWPVVLLALGIILLANALLRRR